MEAGRNRRWAPIALGVALLVAALVALAAVLGVGPFADGELSAAELRERGDEICERAQERFLDAQRAAPRTASDAAAMTADLAELAEEQQDELNSLQAPAELEQPLARYLAARERGIRVLRRGAAAAEQGDASRYEALQRQLERGQAERRRLARRVGFERCSATLRPPG